MEEPPKSRAQLAREKAAAARAELNLPPSTPASPKSGKSPSAACAGPSA